MRELKLKYIIELLSDLGSKSQRDAAAMTEAQKRIQQALKDTNQQLGLVERTWLRWNGVGSASAARQADYLARLAFRYHDVRRAAEGAVGAMQKVASLGSGATAAALTADRLTRTPMEYSQRLAAMANTAFSDRDVAGRIAGKATLDAAINASIRTAGGKRDEAAAALDFLIASGAVKPDVAIRMLPMIMRSSTASGAAPEAIAGIGVRSMQGFGLSLDQLPQALNMAMAAGQAGGFELRDMAKWLPGAMAAGRQSGLTGIEGFRRLLASMQASVITAGTKDEAGNNVVNLLAKINSQDTAKDFAKQGIDLPGELARARGKGVNSLDAFVGLVDRIAARDGQYVALQRKLGQTTDEGERRQMLQSMADILQGKAVGKVIQDRQALMALVAEMNGRGYVRNVMDRTSTDGSAIDTAFGVMSRESEFKRQQMLNEAAIAASESVRQVGPAFDATYEAATRLAREFPVLTTAVVTAAGAIAVATAGILGASLGGRMVGAGGKLLGLGGAAGAAGALGSKAGAMGMVGRMGLYGAALWGSYNIWEAGSALKDWYDISNREGIKVLPRPAPDRGGMMGLGLGAPKADDLWIGSGGAGQGMGRLGEGRLAVDVQVSDERVTARASVAKPLPLIRIDAGNTNPGGYQSWPN